MGDDLDPEKATKMTAGSFGYWTAGMKHVVWAEGETVVQLHGIGPWTINRMRPIRCGLPSCGSTLGRFFVVPASVAVAVICLNVDFLGDVREFLVRGTFLVERRL
jgi:hypothetical protein